MHKAQELAEQAWTAYRRGQVSADHTAKDVFCEVVQGLLTAQRHAATQPPSASGEREALLRELGKASIGSCSCGAKTPDPAAHQYACRYRAIDMARVALAPSPGIDAAEQKPVPFRLGNEYQTQAGEWVRFVSVHREGTDYETMADESGCHRYTSRDFGRLTGTDHDYSHPGNTPPLFAAPPAAPPSAEWLAEAERLVDAAMQAAAEEEALVSKNAPTARAALRAHLKARP